MPSCGMLLRVTLVRTHVSEVLSASFIKVTRICELGTTLAVTNNRRVLRINNMLLIYLIISYFTAYFCINFVCPFVKQLNTLTRIVPTS
jgi:undecaprenyl pyrophosphate phosphatase UppP